MYQDWSYSLKMFQKIVIAPDLYTLE